MSHEYFADLVKKIREDISKLKAKLFTDKATSQPPEASLHYSINAIHKNQQTEEKDDNPIRVTLNLPPSIRVDAKTEEHQKRWYLDRGVWIQIGTIGIATFVAAIYYGQLQTMQTAMKVDQRAWLKFETGPEDGQLANESRLGGDVRLQITPGQPVNYPLRVVNAGKTPATNVTVNIFIDIVDAKEEPPLDHVDKATGFPHAHINTGIMFPNEDFHHAVTRPANDGSPRLATTDEVAAINDGRAYLAVFGIIAYDDIFKIHHWTRFCNFVFLKGTVEAWKCAEYNSVDNN